MQKNNAKQLLATDDASYNADIVGSVRYDMRNLITSLVVILMAIYF